MTTEELAAYYKNLLIIQYKKLTNANDTIDALVRTAIADMLEFNVRDGFNIETAVGPQLDILGALIGIPRTMVGPVTGKNFFSMPMYPSLPTSAFGFYRYGESEPTWYFYKYDDFSGSQYILDDGNYRRLIKFASVSQNMFCSLENINNLLYTFFGANAILTDGGNMTMTYTFTDVGGVVDVLTQAVELMNILPRPSGVGITVTHV